MDPHSHIPYHWQQTAKRFFDFTLAIVILLLLLPVLALIALAVKLESPGAAIFRHRRVGKDGQPFLLYKFRSMASGGDDSGYMRYLQELIASERNGSSQGLPYRKMDRDSRVTRVGKILRCYYLDELPQIFNILRGEMSWVGPRPHVQFEVDNYTDAQRRRLAVPPGLTGLWQVEGKADCTFNELIQLDLDYIDRWSFLFDLKLMLETFLVMLRGGEACWARKAKQVPAGKPDVLAGQVFIESVGPGYSQTFVAKDWFIEVPELTGEYADEER